MRIKNATAAKKISELDDSTIFFVKFIKRSTGEIRDMYAQKGVGKFVKGGEQAYDPSEHNLVGVFDNGKYRQDLHEWRKANATEEVPDEIRNEIGQRCYRSINLENIIQLKIHGRDYFVNDFPVRLYEMSAGSTFKQIRARTEEEAKTSFKREAGYKRVPSNLQIKDRGPVSD